jgi:hypothetical protein
MAPTQRSISSYIPTPTGKLEGRQSFEPAAAADLELLQECIKTHQHI